MDASYVKPPHQKLAEPPYRLGPTFTRPLSMLNPLDYLRILYWEFFHSQWIRDYVKWLSPDYPDRPRHNERLTLLKSNARVRSFFVQSILTAIITPFIISFFLKAIGLPVNLVAVAIVVLVSVAYGVMFCLAFGVANGVVLCVASSVGFGAFIGIASNEFPRIVKGVAFDDLNILWLTIVSILFGGAGFGALAGGIEVTLIKGMFLGIEFMKNYFIGISRLPIYIFELGMASFQKKNHPNPAVKLDGLNLLPIPGIQKELIETIKESPELGVALCAEYINYSLQHSSVKQVVYDVIDNDQNRIHFWCRLLSQYKLFLFLNHRKDLPTDNPWNHICQSYGYIIRTVWLKEIINKSIDYFNIEAHLQHSYEVIHSYAILRDCLGCETAVQIASLATRAETPLNELKNGGGNFNWLDSLPEPELRPELLYVLRELRSIAIETGILTEQTSRARRLSASARASDILLALNVYASQECFEPEKTLLGFIIKRWTEIITRAGGEVGRSALPIDKIPNNYIVGPALRAQKGRLFVGRDDIYREVTRLWSNEQVKQTVVFYGQRRMGKTSILLHMESNLDAQYHPIFLDMQTLATVTSHGAFLYNLADSVSYQLNKTGLGLPIPSRDLYTEEPFIAFRKYIEVAEEGIPPGKWAVLMIDEFELVEEKLKEGAFPSDLMLQFRNIMQHHPRFVLVFAGSHHLDEMRQDYWSPLLNIARVIKVGYLSYSASYELITNPWDDFSLEYRKEVVETIIKAACGQPLLTQSICSGILERVNERLTRGGPEMAPTATLEDAEAEIENILDTSEYFRAVYNALPPDAQNLLKAIALKQKDADEGVGFAEIEIDLPGEEKSAALETLKRRDMIVETGDKIHIAVELVRRWLLR